jgi:hypothetical protein
MVGLCAAALGPTLPSLAAAQRRAVPVLHARIDPAGLYPERLDSLAWSFLETITDANGSKADGGLEFILSNELPVPIVLNWSGQDGIPMAEPLLARAPLAPGQREIQQIPSLQTGTFLCNLRLLGDGQGRSSSALSFNGVDAVPVDRDVTFLIEDWRFRSDGTAVAPGSDPEGTSSRYTVNGKSSFDLTMRANDRLRIRFVNSCQRSVIAVKIELFDVRVMALDSRPAEPFSARNGALVLAPGGRADTFIDISAPSGTTSSILLHDGKEARSIGKLFVSSQAPVRTAPLLPAPALPSNGLPAQPDLKNALHFDLTLGGSWIDWVKPIDFAASSAPAFRAKAGRTVVLALANRADIASVFHLHGHHFRLLDRLDDGWKPFWLDTLAIEAGQTQRVAFAADYAGRWLIEAMATDWAAPRLLRWYSVE